MTPEPKPTSVPDTLVPEHIRLSLGPLTANKEVVLIKAGKANGFNFSEDCLRAAVNLFDNRPSFVNHGDFWSWGQRDVRDLAAHLASPRWDADQKAIIAEYRWYSQAEPLKTLAQEAADKKYFGLSADLFLTRNGQDVQSITAVESVDIVINPAAGGSFTTTDQEEIVQALTLSRFSHPFAPFAIQTPTIQKESTMPNKTSSPPPPLQAPLHPPWPPLQHFLHPRLRGPGGPILQPCAKNSPNSRSASLACPRPSRTSSSAASPPSPATPPPSMAI